MQLYTIKEAASRLAVSPEFLKRLQRQGQLRVVRLGRAVRISEQELQRLSLEGLHKEGV
jgi:excisionase family DNA binding protein